MKEHNLDKDYQELLALEILNHFSEIKIENFKKGESPDWHNIVKSIGIEVVNVDLSRKFFADLKHFDINNIKNIKKFNKKYKENGGTIISKKTAKCIGIKSSSFSFNDSVYLLPVYDDNFKNVNKEIKIKLEKLKNYKDFKDNRLLAFAYNIVHYYKELDIELKELIELCENYEKKFNIIYVCLLDQLIIFDLVKNKYTTKMFQEPNYDGLIWKAYEGVRKNCLQK